MKAKTLQITWHAKEGKNNGPIFSIDFHPELPLLASAGQDNEIKLWRVAEPGVDYKPLASSKNGNAVGVEPTIEYLFTLIGHDTSVNGVRFSPNGECLASVSDGGTVIVWFPGNGNTWASVTDARQMQRLYMRGHAGDVYDLCWAPDSRRLATCSVDNTAVVWDIAKSGSKGVAVLTGHSNFVQGVAWDPTGKYIVTQSTDRTMRVYEAEPDLLPHQGKAGVKRGRKPAAASAPYTCVNVVKNRDIPGVADSGSGALKHHMYLDESKTNFFFRRPAFSPDGSLLFSPAGQVKDKAEAPSKPTTWIFARDSLGRSGVSSGKQAAASSAAQEVGAAASSTDPNPLAHVPAVRTSPALAPASVVVRCSPVLYTLRDPRRRATGEAVPTMPFTLPHRAMYAIATLESVLIYDTQHQFPLAAVANMHYDKITDLAWSPSGRVLLLSSYDGYCSMVVFDGTDLGDRLPRDQWPPALTSQLRSQRSFPVPKAKRAKGAEGASEDAEAAPTEGVHVHADGAPETPPKDDIASAAAELLQAHSTGSAGAEADDEECEQESVVVMPLARAAAAAAAAAAPPAAQAAGPVKRRLALEVISTAAADGSVAVTSLGFTSSSRPAVAPAPVPVSAVPAPAPAISAQHLQHAGVVALPVEDDLLGDMLGEGGFLGNMLSEARAR